MGHIWDSIAQTQEPDCEGVNISIAIPYISDFEQGPGPLCASAFFFFFISAIGINSVIIMVIIRRINDKI